MWLSVLVGVPKENTIVIIRNWQCQKHMSTSYSIPKYSRGLTLMKLVELRVKYQTTTIWRVSDIYVTSAFNRWWLHKLQFGENKKDKMNQHVSESSHTHPDMYTVSITSPCFLAPKKCG